MPEKNRYVDIHGHLNFVAYGADRKEAIKRARRAGVTMITVGTQIDTSRKALELAKSHENMYAVVGLHPIHTTSSDHDARELGEGGKQFTSRGEAVDTESYLVLAKELKVVAIGECGLDFYRISEESLVKQRAAFVSMIEIANQTGKPLMLHLRNGNGKSAYTEALEIIKAHAKVPGNLHFFARSREEAKPFLDIGFTFSFTGVVTFTRDYDDIVRYIPADRIMSETDCPYVSPVPYRGKRNEPAYVIEVVKALAGIRKEDVVKFSEQVYINAKNLFKI